MAEPNRRSGRGPGGPGGPGLTEKPKNLKKTVVKLLRYMGRYRIALIVIVILAIGSTILSIVGPKILGGATDEITQGITAKIQGTGSINFDAIASILIKLIILYGISAICSLIMGFAMTQITHNISYRMRNEISHKIHELPMSYFDKKQNGEVLSVITNDVDTLTMGLNQSATQMVTSIATILGVLYMMFSIDWIMTLVAIVILPISGILVSLIVKKSQKFFKRQQDDLGHVNGQVEESFGGLNVVQAFCTEERTLADFEKHNDSLCDAAWKANFLSGLMHPLMQFVGNIGYVVVAILGGSFIISGRITVGNIQAFIQYMRNFTQPIAQVAQVSSMLQSTAAAAERVFEILEESAEEQVAEHHAPVRATELSGSVAFDHVHFGYTPDKIIINDFTATVRSGQKIAIVGPTGAGKTTMVKLLMRFYDLNGGAILLDGYNNKDFDRSELREAFGMVLQDTWLFSGTILENIRYGRLEATDEEVYAAAKAANVHHFVQTLPDGYDMILNEDASNVSGGQKQLLTIARTILADPKILILDEATSSVDTRTEVQIQKAMDTLMQGRTSFIIAHRLSTIRNADLILMMKDGDIVEQGTHEQLLAQNGAYAEMYNSQFA